MMLVKVKLLEDMSNERTSNIKKAKEIVFVKSLGMKGVVHERISRRVLVELPNSTVWVNELDTLKI